MSDCLLVGTTAENIFLALMNEAGITAVSYDTKGFDGIVIDKENRYFKVGKHPFYVQIKCRGCADENCVAGYGKKVFEKISNIATADDIPQTSLYVVLGFYRYNDIRQMKYWIVPFSSLKTFDTGKSQYRFSPKICEKAMLSDSNIKSI